MQTYAGIAAGLLMLGACIWVLFFRKDSLAEAYVKECDERNDRNLQAVAQHAWASGKPCIGNVDENGQLTIKNIE